MNIGISIYLGTGLEENIKILKRAKAANVSWAFTSLQIPEEQVADYEKETKRLLAACKEYGMQLIADISPETVKKLSCGSVDALASWGIASIRLDYGYSPREIAALSKTFQIVLNASTITAADIRGWKHAGADLSRFIACHNYYPKEYTGLSLERVREVNEYLKLEGLQTMAFVPGDKTMRGPLFAGLPTIEAHRFSKHDLVRNMLELHFDGSCDMVMVGDIDLTEMAWDGIGLLSRDIVAVNARLDEKYHFVGDMIHRDRVDSSSYIFRSVESRALTNKIRPEHCTERKKGSICISNCNYLRYEGEVEIAKKDLPPDERVNVIGSIDAAHLLYLPYIKHGMGVQLKYR